MMPDREGMEMKPPLPKMPWIHQKLLLKYASYFSVEGKPGDTMITEGQLHIFGSIIIRNHNRVQIITSTQYGKSLWVALACLILTCVLGKVVVVVAPSADKAKIIMRYYIDHLGDNPLFFTKLEKNSKLERLKQEENKSRIMLNNGGGIFVVSADQKNSKKSVEAAMGQGAEIVIGDEFCLIEDSTEATIFRMIAGKGPDACYIKIGNPFYSAPPNSHFLRSWLEIGKYHRIFIDYHQAIREGRYNEEFIMEARSKPLFDILFDCLFPNLSEMDAEGYRLLVIPNQIKFGVTPELMKELMEKERAQNDGKLKIAPKIGGDIGGGGDWNVFVLRWGKFACVVAKNKSNDTMTNVSLVQELMEEWGVRMEDVNIDDIGVGRGVTDRLHELGILVNAVNVGVPAEFDPDSFSNLKAELCWEARKWIMAEDTRLDKRDEWVQLTWLKYKTISDRKVQMEDKKKLKARTGSSPDFAEAFYLTFAQGEFVGFA
jgi:hypothetical protein